MFGEYFRQGFADTLGVALDPARDGYPVEELEQSLSARGLTIPRALRDYYLVAGRHPINREHNRLLTPDELVREGDYLVFLEENQNVVFWGIRREDLSTNNPVVWQGVNAETVRWYAEDFPLAEFLMATWEWTRNGG